MDSMKIYYLASGTAVVAEWFRRWTRNPLGSARTGSNPVYSDLIFIIFFSFMAVVSEWLRRWTRNPLGSARTGSNPVRSGYIFIRPKPFLAAWSVLWNHDIPSGR